MSSMPAFFLFALRAVDANVQINNAAVGSCHPDVPNNVVITSSSTGQVDVTWEQPTDPGDTVINSFEISTDGFLNCYSISPSIPPSPTHTETLSLTPGFTYQVAVRAVNAQGPGAAIADTVVVSTRRLAAGGDSGPSPRRLQTDYCAAPAPCPSSASVMGDPVTYFGNLKREFSLPLNTPTSLLLMPDMEVFATTFKGKLDHEQWINRISINGAAGEQIVQVDIKDCLIGFNRTGLPPHAPETLRISMDWMDDVGPITEWPPSVYYQHWNGAVIKFSKLRAKLDSVTPHREVVLVEGRFAGLIIESASAREWYGEDELVTREYAHLDLHVINIRNISLFRGLLPELWGVREPSDVVRRATQTTKLHYG